MLRLQAHSWCLEQQPKNQVWPRSHKVATNTSWTTELLKIRLSALIYAHKIYRQAHTNSHPRHFTWALTSKYLWPPLRTFSWMHNGGIQRHAAPNHHLQQLHRRDQRCQWPCNRLEPADGKEVVPVPIATPVTDSYSKTRVRQQGHPMNSIGDYSQAHSVVATYTKKARTGAFNSTSHDWMNRVVHAGEPQPVGRAHGERVPAVEQYGGVVEPVQKDHGLLLHH